MTRIILVAMLLAVACCRGGQPTTTPGPAPAPPTPPDVVSPTEPPRDPNAVCQKDRPCDAAAPPKCADSGRPKALADIFASGNQLAGATVTIAAPLRAGPMRCTRMACSEERPCCNRCGSGMVLAVDDPNQTAGQSVVLNGEGLECPGDDSGVCCPFTTDGRAVVATGTLRVDGDATSGFTWILEGARLCAP